MIPHFIVLSLVVHLLASPLSLPQKQPDSDCGCALEEAALKLAAADTAAAVQQSIPPTEVTFTVPTITDDRIQRLCSMARKQFVGGGKNKFKKALGMFLNIKEDDPLYKEKMSAFWKENMHRFICKYRKTQGREFPQMHIFKRLLYENHFQFFDDTIFGDEFEVDFNFVEVRDGKEETIIDYLDALIARVERESDPLYNLNFLKATREGIYNYGGRKASDL